MGRVLHRGAAQIKRNASCSTSSPSLSLLNQSLCNQTFSPPLLLINNLKNCDSSVIHRGHKSHHIKNLGLDCHVRAPKMRIFTIKDVLRTDMISSGTTSETLLCFSLFFLLSFFCGSGHLLTSSHPGQCVKAPQGFIIKLARLGQPSGSCL